MDIKLPYLISTETCNPLSIRMLSKITESEVIDGGNVLSKKLDKTNEVNKFQQKPDWILTKNAFYYCFPQNEFIKEFSFFEWEVNAHLSNFVKKIKNFHAIRLFKVKNYETYNPQLFRRTLDSKNKSVEFYDFYVVNGKELNITTIHSYFKDNKGYKVGV